MRERERAEASTDSQGVLLFVCAVVVGRRGKIIEGTGPPLCS